MSSFPDSAARAPTWPDAAVPPVPFEVAAAIETVLLRNTHLESQLDPGHPPAEAGIPAAIAHYGSPTDAFHRWAAWSAIEVLRRAWRAAAPAGTARGDRSPAAERTAVSSQAAA